jgi:lysophospholipase L1-like esterase
MLWLVEIAMRLEGRWGTRCGALGLLALTACGGGSPAVAPAFGDESASFSLAIIGSSTAAGEGASRPERAWVAQLAKALAAETSFRVSNLAVEGYTTSDLLPGSESSGNIDDAIDGQPNLILVALAGSNDIAAGTSSSEFLSRLSRLRDRAEAAAIPTFFVSTAPKDLSDVERQRLADWASAMAQRFEQCWVPAAATYSPCFADVFDGLADPELELAGKFDSGDGIHLNDAGHAVVFRAAEPIVQQYECSVSACR